METAVGSRAWVFVGTIRDRDGMELPRILMRMEKKLPILRHVKIKGELNPYDPVWEDYLDKRLYTRLDSTLGGVARSTSYGGSKRGFALDANSYCARTSSGKCIIEYAGLTAGQTIFIIFLSTTPTTTNNALVVKLV